jgi:hypothetical protein
VKDAAISTAVMNLTISSIEPMMNTMILTMTLSSSSMKIGMLSSTHGG